MVMGVLDTARAMRSSAHPGVDRRSASAPIHHEARLDRRR
jgi:hypothetical protein